MDTSKVLSSLLLYCLENVHGAKYSLLFIYLFLSVHVIIKCFEVTLGVVIKNISQAL